jgi:hypothetical protein
MGDITTMRARDAVSSKLATAYVTIDGNRYLLFQAKSFEASFKKTKKTVDILGRTSQGNKASGWSGTFKLTIYHNTEIFNDMFEKYKNTGEDIYFDIQVTNDDSTSAAGRNTKIYKDCNLDDGVLQKFDASGDLLEQDLNGTFEDFESPEKFVELDGMR